MRREDPNELPSALVGRPAPEIARTVALRDDPAPTAADLTAPGVKLVNFWASWCGPCRVEHPLLKALAAEGVPVIGINYKDRPENALGFLRDLGDPYAQDRRGRDRPDRARLGDLRGAGDLRGGAGRGRSCCAFPGRSART